MTKLSKVNRSKIRQQTISPTPWIDTVQKIETNTVESDLCESQDCVLLQIEERKYQKPKTPNEPLREWWDSNIL